MSSNGDRYSQNQCRFARNTKIFEAGQLERVQWIGDERRTSTTVLVDGGGDISYLKRHEKWTLNAVAVGYIEDSFFSKENIAKRILRVDSDNDKSSTVVIFYFTSEILIKTCWAALRIALRMRVSAVPVLYFYLIIY